MAADRGSSPSAVPKMQADEGLAAQRSSDQPLSRTTGRGASFELVLWYSCGLQALRGYALWKDNHNCLKNNTRNFCNVVSNVTTYKRL